MPSESLLVNEIFLSIQGESSFAGLPCTFIRLTGCNLRCSYCDTPYAYEEGTWMSVPDILSTIRSMGGGELVEVTGGEPLLQDPCLPLMDGLLQGGHTVLVETNGSLDIRCLPEPVVCILDMKCPSSGMSHRMQLENLHFMRRQDELKFVIRTREDYQWATSILKEHTPPLEKKPLFSPAHPDLKPQQLAEWILADRLQVRLQVPLHRVLWPESLRGK